MFLESIARPRTWSKRERVQRREESKQRVTVALMANAAGEIETPVLIGMSERPRCFKGVGNLIYL